MANIKISELPAASSVALTDEFEANQSGTSRKATAAQIAASVFVNTAPTLGWYSPSADLIRTPNSVTIDDQLVVSGTGPHAIGAAAVDFVRNRIGGNFTSGGSSTVASHLFTLGSLTGASGDTGYLTGTTLQSTITTQAAAEAITVVAQLQVFEPNITIGTATVTNAVTLYIPSAPTEGTNNYALWVDAGTTRLDGNVGIGAASFGTNAAAVLSMTTGTAPTTGPADTVQFYSSDDAAGHTIPSFYCEGTNVIATGQADSVSSVRVKMRINGTVVTLLAI